MSTQIPVKTATLIYTLSQTIGLGAEAIAEVRQRPAPTARDKAAIEDGVKEIEESLVKVKRFIKLLQEAAKHPAFDIIKVEMEDFEKFGLLEYDIPGD